MGWIEEEIGIKHGKPEAIGYPEWKMAKLLEDRDEAMERFTKKLNEKEQ